MFDETWIKSLCRYCKTINWIKIPENFDIDVVVCHNCKEKYFPYDDTTVMDVHVYYKDDEETIMSPQEMLDSDIGFFEVDGKESPF